jgi:hypothetical protein
VLSRAVAPRDGFAAREDPQAEIWFSKVALRADVKREPFPSLPLTEQRTITIQDQEGRAALIEMAPVWAWPKATQVTTQYRQPQLRRLGQSCSNNNSKCSLRRMTTLLRARRERPGRRASYPNLSPATTILRALFMADLR